MSSCLRWPIPVSHDIGVLMSSCPMGSDFSVVLLQPFAGLSFYHAMDLLRIASSRLISSHDIVTLYAGLGFAIMPFDGLRIFRNIISWVCQGHRHRFCGHDIVTLWGVESCLSCHGWAKICDLWS